MSAAWHGYGAHVATAGVAARFSAGHAAPGSATEHTPVITLQQAVGCGQFTAPHVVPPGFAAAVPAGHAAPASVTVHAPLARSQHATGCGHSPVVHATPSPWKFPKQFGEAVGAHSPEAKQHAPTHVLAPQVVPSPRYCVAHPPRAVTVHPPMKSQHAPFGQGSGVHTSDAGEASDDPAGHAVLAATTLHTPVVVSQHALGPHGFGAHVDPSPWYTPPGMLFMQMNDPTMRHVWSIELQHAPEHGFTGEHVAPTPRKLPL
jgi:hypothetical protein